jgi:hypothetical protein
MITIIPFSKYLKIIRGQKGGLLGLDELEDPLPDPAGLSEDEQGGLCEALTRVCLLIEGLNNVLFFVSRVLLIILIMWFLALIDVLHIQLELHAFLMARLE